MSPEHLAQLIQLRHELHKTPEVSGDEEQTAALIVSFLKNHSPDQILTGLGGHGVAAIYDGAADGPTVMVRCELDGLPIQEISSHKYRSTHPGRGHLCGHDGHMAMVAGVAMRLSEQRPKTGRVVLLFQPAKETGKGAAAVLADPRFKSIAPDLSFSLHNLPGLAKGHVALSQKAANCASRGMRIRLIGKTSHAAAPLDGLSPSGAISKLIPALEKLGSGGRLSADYSLVTVTHCKMGEATFGITPGEAEVWATLRTVTDAAMAQMVKQAENLVANVAGKIGLKVDIEYDDVFLACTNHSDAVEILDRAGRSAGCKAELRSYPQLWSEDFGQFSTVSKAAMFWLGSGESQPQLHNPDYDFPDEILPIGTEVFVQAIEQVLNT